MPNMPTNLPTYIYSERLLTLYSKFRFLIHQLQCMDHLEIWKEISNKICLEFLKNYDKQEFFKSDNKKEYRWLWLLVVLTEPPGKQVLQKNYSIHYTKILIENY